MGYEQMANKAYSKDSEEKRYKAVAAGKAIDNALKTEYSAGDGTTKSHFMMHNWLKYFSTEALGDRIKLVYNLK